MIRKLVFGCVCFCFHKKSATTLNRRSELNEISYSSPFNRDSNNKKNAKRIFTELRKIGMKCLMFGLILSKLVSKLVIAIAYLG